MTVKLFKVKPIIDLLKRKLSELVPSEYLSTDELMVPFKGRSHLKQYNLTKVMC